MTKGRALQGTRTGEDMYVLRYIVNQGTKQSESQHLLHSKRPRHVTYFCSHFSAETVAFQCGTQWSKFHEGYVPKARELRPKMGRSQYVKICPDTYININIHYHRLGTVNLESSTSCVISAAINTKY